jgi:hypothetical protein
MNIIGGVDGHEIVVELKYCERCGGLWLRMKGTKGLYCATCHETLAARPDPGDAPARKPRKRKARMQAGPKPERPQDSGQIENLQGAALAVWA